MFKNELCLIYSLKDIRKNSRNARAWQKNRLNIKRSNAALGLQTEERERERERNKEENRERERVGIFKENFLT